MIMSRHTTFFFRFFQEIKSGIFPGTTGTDDCFLLRKHQNRDEQHDHQHLNLLHTLSSGNGTPFWRPVPFNPLSGQSIDKDPFISAWMDLLIASKGP